MKKIVLALIVVFSFIFGFIYLKKNNTYKVIKAQQRDVVESVYGSGYIDSKNSVIIKSQVSGYIQKIFVHENQRVMKGQVLAIISNQTLLENLKDIESQIQYNTERLKEDSAYIKELKSSIEIKRLNLENLKNMYERRKQLFEKGLIPKESFEEIEKNLNIAQKDYEKQVKLYEDSIFTLKSQVNSLVAKKNAVLAEIEKHSIKSPVDGVVLRKFVNEGDYINNISSSNQLFLVGNPDSIETVINIDEEYVPMLKEGQKVLVVLDSYPKDIFEGKITTIESAVDRTTRTVKVKADINYTKSVTVGMVVEANIVLSVSKKVFIPQNAIKDGYVEIFEDGKIKKIKVQIGKRSYNGYIEIEDGLSAGQEIVVR